MATKFSFLANDQIRWPPVCVVCGHGETVLGRVHGSTFKGLGWWGFGYSVKYDKIQISYPICRRHMWLARAIRVMYFGSFLVLLFALPQLLVLDSTDRAVFYNIVFVCILTSIAFLFAMFSSPVQVGTSADGDVIVKICNEIYAKAFEALNQGVIRHSGTVRKQQREQSAQSSLGYKLGQFIGRVLRRFR